jgi:prolyl oligopeptidase
MDRIQGGTDKDAAVYYHVIGTSQRKASPSHPASHTDLDELVEDILVYQDREHPEWMFRIDVSDDGKYLYLQIFKDREKVGHVINKMTFIN